MVFDVVLTFTIFIRAPCRRACVLKEHMCPPPEVLHLINDHPHYYDPLYFPQFHLSPFNDPQTLFHWLASALNDHCENVPSLRCSQLYKGLWFL